MTELIPSPGTSPRFFPPDLTDLHRPNSIPSPQTLTPLDVSHRRMLRAALFTGLPFGVGHPIRLEFKRHACV